MLLALFKTMRPRQWTKNAIVLAPLVFDRQLGNLEGVARSAAALALFCLLSSAIYIINDLVDLEADRQHPKKKLRPLAAGQLSPTIAIAAALVILLIIFPLAYLLSPAFAAITAGYFLLNLAYSKWLKHIPLIDVMVIAAGFVLRVAGGVTVIQVKLFSPWLYVVTTLLSLYIGFGKRRAELALLDKGANSHRPVLEGYTIPLLDQIITVVSSSTIVAYSLYTFSAPISPNNHAMMLTIPFVLYGVFRYLYLVQVKQYGGAPEELLLSDHPLQAAIALWGLSIVAILYFIT
jgi:4-hydroxybenzoate polyprenyltransferase